MNKKKFAFYSSSILLAYDAAQPAAQTAAQTGAQVAAQTGAQTAAQSPESLHRPICNATMIDFTHVFPTNENENDANYIRGLEKLIKFVEKVFHSESQ